MKENEKLAIKLMVCSQKTVDYSDDFGGTSGYVRQLKLKGKSFVKELEVFVDSGYANGSTDKTMIDFMEYCDKGIDKVFEDAFKRVQDGRD